MAEQHVIQEKPLRSFCEQVLTKLGVPKADAQIVTDVLVVAAFGRTSILGTNPISLAAPAMNGKAFVLDMATSTVPRGKVEVYNRLGKPMPHGWAVDETGRSSTDPKRVLDALANRLGGGLLPLG